MLDSKEVFIRPPVPVQYLQYKFFFQNLTLPLLSNSPQVYSENTEGARFSSCTRLFHAFNIALGSVLIEVQRDRQVPRKKQDQHALLCGYHVV